MLTIEAVENLMRACLNGGPENALLVEGLVRNFGFSPKKIEENTPEIVKLLNELPETFRENSGGGWSFLMASQDKHGNHWGEHRNIEELMCLGIAAGKVRYVIEDREMWKLFPGGVPHFVIME